MISLIAAMSQNRVIGKNQSIPWHISEDYIYFSKLTTNNIVIMGRNTHESISGFTNFKGWDSSKPFRHKLLPNRTTIILTTQANYKVKGAYMASSLTQALTHARNHDSSKEVFIIGGESLYKTALNEKIVDKIYLTLIEEDVDGDVFFPAFESDFTLESEKKRIVRVNQKEIRYSFNTYLKN